MKSNISNDNNLLIKIFFIFIGSYAINYFIIDVYNWYSSKLITLFFNKTDIHADAIKAALSLKSIIGDPSSLPMFKAWNGIFQGYIVGYSDYSGVGTPGTIYHHPPLTFFYFETIAFAMRWGFNPRSIVLFIALLSISLLVLIIFNIKRKFNLSSLEFACLVTLSLFCYPFIFALNRANFPAIFSFLLLYFWIFNLSEKNKFLPLAFALNIRPNIFFAALPFLKFDRFNYKYLLTLIIQAFLIFILFLYISNDLNNKYSVESFLSSLNEYKKSYLFMGPGDAYNSSLHSLSRFFSIVFGINYYATYFSYLLIYLALVLYVYLFIRINNTIRSFIGASACMILTPVFADYHLLIFLVPLTFSVIEYKITPYISNIIGLITILLISPKVNFLNHGFTPNTYINPFLVLLGFIFICKYCKPVTYNSVFKCFKVNCEK